jgi:hypothetical protein
MLLAHIIALSSIQPTGLPQPAADNGTVSKVLQIVFGIAGSLALLMITVSGLRYITSAGDPEKAARARNGIVYALIGLVLAISFEAIVTFIIGNL